MPSVRRFTVGNNTNYTYDYPTFEALATARAGANLVNDDVIEEWHIYSEGAAYTDRSETLSAPISINQTTDSTRYLVIKQYSDPFYNFILGTSNVINVTAKNVVFDGVGLYSFLTGACLNLTIPSGGDVTIKNCSLRHTSSQNNTGIAYQGSGTLKIFNNILVNSRTGITLNAASNGVVAIYNNTFDSTNNPTFIRKASSGVTEYIKNNGFVGTGTVTIGASGANILYNFAQCDYNFATSGTSPILGSNGGGNVGSSSTFNVLSYNVGLITVNSTAYVINRGTNLSADAICPFDTDRYGNYRADGRWDIGFYEYVNRTPKPNQHLIDNRRGVNRTFGVIMGDNSNNPNFTNYQSQLVGNTGTGGTPARFDYAVKAVSGQGIDITENRMGVERRLGYNNAEANHYVDSVRTDHYNGLTYNAQTGAYSATPSGSQDSLAPVETVPFPTRAVPGTFRIMEGAKIPLSVDYAPKTT